LGAAVKPPLGGQWKRRCRYRFQRGKHVDQSIDAEEIDSTADEIADSRLRNSKQLSRFRLSEAAVLYELTHCNHQA
jgi:hypothetical protein